MKTLIFILALAFSVQSVKAADLNFQEYLEPEEQQAVERLPAPIVYGSYNYLAHAFVAKRTFKTCSRYPIFINIISQYADVEEEAVWQGPQFDQQILNGYTEIQQRAIKKLGIAYGRELGKNTEVKTSVPLTTEKIWCEYRGSVLFDLSINKIYSTNYQNFLTKRDAWVQATQDLSMLVFE